MPQADAANVSKLNSYAVLDTNAAEVSKLNVYAVLQVVTLTTLTASAGSFSLTGQSTTFQLTRRLSASAGALALTGIDADLPNPKMFFPGTFALTGQAATFLHTRSVSAAVGSFTLTGIDADLSNFKMVFGGAFDLTGQSATFRYNRTFPVSAGSFALTGQSAFGGKGKNLLAESRQFTLTGRNAVIGRNSTLDPYRNFVTYLHHCDSRTESILNENVIPIGNTVVSTTVSKFGIGSFALDGTGDYFYSLNRAYGFAFSTAPFTMEMWARFNTAAANATLMQQMGGWKFGLVSGQISFWANNNNVQSGTAAFTPNPGQWYNFTVDRDASNVFRIYVDGVMVVKTTGYNEIVGGSTSALWFGYGDSYFNGYIDEIRLTRGVARYASDGGFTVATTPFSVGVLPADPGTFTATGGEATFSRSQPFLLARSGAFSLQGQSARLNGVSSGSYTLAGNDAALIKRIPTRLYTARGVFDLVGGAALFERRKAVLGDRATFALSGRTARLLHGHHLPLGSTSYALTGVSARALKWPRVRATAGAFSLTLPGAALRRGRRLSAGPGVFTASGTQISAVIVRKLISASGSFALSGGSSGVIENQRLRGQTADFNLATVPARLLEHHRIAANSGQFDETGQAASLERGWRLPASAGAFAWAGISAKKSIVRTGRPGRFRLTGQTAELWAGWGGDAVGVVSSPAAVAQVTAQGVVAGSVTAPRAQAAWSDR